MPDRCSIAARLLALVAPCALLGACATASAPRLRPAIAANSPPVAGAEADASIYGLYLAGETALDKGERGEAARYLSAASARSPSAGFLKERAFAAALLAGQVDRAANLAPRPGEGDEAAYALGRVTTAVVALADGRGRAAYQTLSASSMGTHWAAAVLLTPWAAAAAGDWAAAAAAIPAGKDHAVQAFADLEHALVLDRAGDARGAEAAFRAMSVKSGVFGLAYGGFLERRGGRAAALAIYNEGLQKDPTDPAFLAAKTRAAAAPPPRRPSIKSAAAEALIGPAALLLAQKQPDAGLAYLRLALRLDPALAEAWVLVGDALESQQDNAGARDAYLQVRPDSPEFTTAQGRLALNLQGNGDKAQALATAQAALVRRPDDPHLLLVLCDLYRDDERYAESVQTLDRLLAVVGPDTANLWRLYYLRGASLERQGKWDAAEGDLQKALTEKPDDPEVLNYLGFAWVDRGEHLSEALGLLQKATALAPDSGAVVDSLGWAHYRLHQYNEAVRQLERAASLDPADPEINDHLGDAYWRAGRRLEAQYQWRRVLTLDPGAVVRASASTKLAQGLPGAAPGAPVAPGVPVAAATP